MDKYELKNKLSDIYAGISKLAGTLVEKGCQDEETAEIRSRVLSLLNDTNEAIRKEIHEIY